MAGDAHLRIMDLEEGMAAEITVLQHVRPSMIAATRWLLHDEPGSIPRSIAVNTSFQALNWYRVREITLAEQELFADRRSTSRRIHLQRERLGQRYSKSAPEWMQDRAARQVHMVEHAGHWVQQEQPEETCRLLIEFLRGVRSEGTETRPRRSRWEKTAAATGPLFSVFVRVGPLAVESLLSARYDAAAVKDCSPFCVPKGSICSTEGDTSSQPRAEDGE